MRSPGVEVRPLRQITGEAEFNEVYLTDVRIPDADRIGAVGEGWRVALTTLMNERTAIGGSAATSEPARGGAALDAVKIWQRPARRGEDPGPPRRADEDVEPRRGAAAHEQAGRREHAGRQPRPGGIGRQARPTPSSTRTSTTCASTCSAPTGQVGFDYTFRRPDDVDVEGGARGPRHAFLRVRANSIEGGTSEIMRNILGEQVLGLPGEPRVDKDQPWSKVPR